jgi:putative ABC transport system permease protein
VGEAVQLTSDIPPYQIGRPFDFVIRGIYDADRVKNPGADVSSFFFHYEYLYEATNRRTQAGNYVIEIDDPNRAAQVSEAVDALFANSDAETKTETEGAFVAGFISLAGNLSLLLNAIGLAVTFTILLVTANTMSMAVRERRKEVAVLKTLGFPGALVLALILGEALLLGIAGGGLGLTLGSLSISVLQSAPMLGSVLTFYPNIGLTTRVAALGMVLAVALSLMAGFVPAMLAYRAKVTEMLREV